MPTDVPGNMNANDFRDAVIGMFVEALLLGPDTASKILEPDKRIDGVKKNPDSSLHAGWMPAPGWKEKVTEPLVGDPFQPRTPLGSFMVQVANYKASVEKEAAERNARVGAGPSCA